MSKPVALVTNDDGIRCFFLRKLVEGLRPHFELFVVAPHSEQSWIGKAVSRHRKVKVDPFEGLGCPAWVVDGTPSDCVNIALGNLLDRAPDIVVSGINVGYNMTMPLILSSGTISGALEGACWRLPAVAFSQQLTLDIYDTLKTHGNDTGTEELDRVLSTSGQRAATLAKEVLETEDRPLVVHSFNFPFTIEEDTPVMRTRPDLDHIGACFADTGEHHEFAFKKWDRPALRGDTDRYCLQQGQISHTVLNYGALGAVE